MSVLFRILIALPTCKPCNNARRKYARFNLQDYDIYISKRNCFPFDFPPPAHAVSLPIRQIL